MNRLERARGWAVGLLAGLGVYGTLAGLGLLPLPAAVIAVVVGNVVGQITIALAVALVISLSANVVLAIALGRRKTRSTNGRDRVPRPKTFEVEGDLGTLILTSEDLETWWNNALAVARGRVGPGLRAYVEAIHISPSPFIVMYGESTTAFKGFGGTVSGPDPTHVDFYGVYKKDELWEKDPAEPLWRTDDTWRELVRLSWLRERPVRSGCTIYPRSVAGSRFWEAAYGPYSTDDERHVNGRDYRIENGTLRLR